MTKNITELKKGESGTVAGVELSADLCERLKMLGVSVGARVRLLKIAPFQSGYLLSAGAIRFALGKSVACKVFLKEVSA